MNNKKVIISLDNGERLQLFLTQTDFDNVVQYMKTQESSTVTFIGEQGRDAATFYIPIKKICYLQTIE